MTGAARLGAGAVVGAASAAACAVLSGATRGAVIDPEWFALLGAVASFGLGASMRVVLLLMLACASDVIEGRSLGASLVPMALGMMASAWLEGDAPARWSASHLRSSGGFLLVFFTTCAATRADRPGLAPVLSTLLLLAFGAGLVWCWRSLRAGSRSAAYRGLVRFERT